MTMQLLTPITASSSPQLTDAERALISEMLNQWARHLRGNKRRQNVYDQHSLFKDLRIAVPPQLRNLEAVLGWGTKAVDAPADRINFERFVLPGVESNPYGLDDIVADNEFQVEFSQLTTSALTHSCAFVSLAQGFDGEPESLWLTRSAEQATGIWDRRKRGLRAGLTVSKNAAGETERIFVYFPDKSVEVTVSGRNLVASIMPNHTGRLPLEVFRFRPNLRRPFGRSRITRAVEYFIHGGVRTIVRSEVGAEFFAAPQRYGIGLSEDAFDMDKWNAVVGRFLAVTRDEEGELPTLGQFPQHSMQPHGEHLRMWASQMSGESSIPMNELGFFTENPSSDGAIQSQRDPLRLIANDAIRGFQSSLRRLAVTSIMVRDRLTEAPDELRRLDAKFAPTFHVTDAAAADAALKQATIIPWIAESPVFLERLNYSPQEVERLLADKRKAGASAVLDRLAAGRGEPATEEQPEEPKHDTPLGDGVDSAAMKARFDALGAAV